MSGETEKDISGWTVDTLRAHFQKEIDDLQKMLQERYETQTKAVDAAFLAQQTAMQTALSAAEKAVQAALAAAEKAVSKAEAAAEKRFESVNEFRGQLTDQATTFISRNEYESKHEALIERMNGKDIVMGERMGRVENILANIQGRMIAYAGGGALLGGIVVAIILRALNGLFGGG